MQSRGEVDALIDALRHSEATVRKGAAAALRALGAWQAVPALEAALIAEHDWQAHAAITAALQYLDRDIHIETMVKNKDIRGLTKMLNSRRIEDVLTACEALSTIGDRNAAEGLVMVFRNPLLPNNARLAAAEALLKLESAPAVVTLLGALRRDNWQVRRNAAAVLGQLQAGWATEPLIKALQDPNVTVRRTAAAALRRIASPEAIVAAAAFEATQKKSTQELDPVEPAQQVAQEPVQSAQRPQVPEVTAAPGPAPAPAAITDTSVSVKTPSSDGSNSPVAEPVKSNEGAKPAEADKSATVAVAPPTSSDQPDTRAASTAEPASAAIEPPTAPMLSPTPTSFADALPTPAVFRKGTTGPLSSVPAAAPGAPAPATNADNAQPNAAENLAPENSEKPTSSSESQDQKTSAESTGNSPQSS